MAAPVVTSGGNKERPANSRGVQANTQNSNINHPRQQQQQQKPQQSRTQRGNNNTQSQAPKPVTAATEDEKRTKDMLNNIWNSLKVNPQIPQVTAAAAPTLPSNNNVNVVTAPQELDLTETLRNVLRIAPSVAASGAVKSEAPIKQPAPAQLPPPPANWRIEAQMKHLNQVRAPPMPHPPMPPQIRHQQGAPMFQQQMGHRFPPPQMRMMNMPPGPPMAYPQHGGGGGNGAGGFPPQGPIVMPGFRPVAAMPFTHSAGPPPFMNPHNGGGMGPNRQFHPQNQSFNRGGHSNNSHHHYEDEHQNQFSGPSSLRNTASVSGHGAFIPLQAARKISKLKSVNGQPGLQQGQGKAQSVAVAEQKQATGSQSTAEALKPDKENQSKEQTPQPKKAPVTKAKPNSAPRPPRIAANFSVNK